MQNRRDGAVERQNGGRERRRRRKQICIDGVPHRRCFNDVVSIGSENVPPGNGHATEGKEHFLHRARFASSGDTKFEVEKIEDVMQHESPIRPVHLGICITFLKRRGGDDVALRSHRCRQVYDSLSQGQKTARPRGPKRSPGGPSGGFWGVSGRRPRRARNARGGVFAWKSLHFLHEDDFSSVKPILKNLRRK